MRYSIRHIRFAAAIVLAACIPACTSYQVVADPAAALQPSTKPVESVRVTLKSGKRFDLYSPRVDGDSLRGMFVGGAPQAYAMASVAKVEVEKSSSLGTAKLGFVLIGVGLIIAMAASISNW